MEVARGEQHETVRSPRPGVISLQRRAVFLDPVVACVDEQYAVARRNRDAGRLACRVADRIYTRILSAIELRNGLAFQVERPHAAVVRVGDQYPVAIGSDAERMLQSGGSERPIGLAEVEQAGSDERLGSILVAERDRADRRALRVGDV